MSLSIGFKKLHTFVLSLLHSVYKIDEVGEKL